MTIIILFIFVPALICILLLVNLLLAPQIGDAEKESGYECGFIPLYAQTRNPFSISFYLVALLFLIFDLEIALVYPVAVSLTTVGNYGFWIVLGFLGVLTIGFCYEYGTKALNFTDHRSSISRPVSRLFSLYPRFPNFLPLRATGRQGLLGDLVWSGLVG